MESLSQEKIGTHVITIQQNDTVLAAFPFGPHISLLDFLKGEPKVLGGIQILLALIIVGLGAILAFGYISFSELFPLVFLSGYPFWGAFIFFLTGSLIVIDEKLKNIQIRGIVTMSVLSSVVAVTGIALILISYTQQHKFCQMLSLEGSCGLGRAYFIGILSILLVVTIVELGISVTIASFRSKCWTSSDEVVFFLPSQVTPNNEQLNPEENTVLQFKLQEDSSGIGTTSNRQTVFFGGYSFFKLRVLRSPLAHHCILQTCSKCNVNSHASAPTPEEEIGPKPLPPTSEEGFSENKINEDLQYAITPSPPIQTLQALPSDDLPSRTVPIQAPPEQVMLYKTPPTHVRKFLDLTTEDLPSEDVFIQESSEDTLFQDTTSTQSTLQAVAYESLSAQATPLYSEQHPKIQQLSQDIESQNIQIQTQPSSEILFKDIRTEVMEQSQEWKSQGKYPKRFSFFHKTKEGKCRKRLSLELPSRKGKQPPRRHSLDLQTKGGQSLRRKSLDQKIRAWLSAKSQFLSKQSQHSQTTQQPVEDLKKKGEQSLKEQSKDGEDKEQQVIKEQFPKKQLQDKQAEDQQAQEEKFPKEQSQSWQAKGPQVQMKKALRQLCHDWDSLNQEQEDGQFPAKKSLQWTKQNWQSFQPPEDWISQGWRNKDWMARDWQSEIQHALKQKSLYQEVPNQNTRTQYNLARQSPDKDQKDLQSRGEVKEDTQGRHIKKGKPTSLQSGDVSSDYQPSSSQSLDQDPYLTCWSNIDSEPEVKQYASTSSNSYRDLNITSTTSSCGSKDPQQSEDSD